jgi:phage-related protein
VGIGREVADAYIDVHGDLSSFRRDLGGADVRGAAFEAADEFSAAWAKRVNSDVSGKWASIINAMYSEKQVDWDRMLGEFNPRSLDDARTKLREFLDEMANARHLVEELDEEGKKTGAWIDEGPKLAAEEYEKMAARLNEVIDGMEKQEDLQRKLAENEEILRKAQEEAHRMNEAWMKRRAKTMQEAIDLNKAWARTWEGMRKNNALSDMEADFKRLADAMSFADLEKFGKSFDSLDKARVRINEVTAAMEEQGRISTERAQEVRDHFNAFMDSEAAKAKAMRDALDETNRLKAAQDKYNKSLDGMVRAANFQRMERDFKMLTDAIASGDWSNLARGSRNMSEMRRRILQAANEMRNLGRMTDAEFRNISTRIDDAGRNMRAYNIEFERASETTKRFSIDTSRLRSIFSRLNTVTKGFREHLQALGGLNVFGDMIRKGLDFVHNMDRVALSIGKNTLAFGTLAAVGASAFAGLVTVAADLGDILGGLGVLAPAFLIGAGIGIGVMSAALKDMDTVLADLKPAFANLQDTISAKFWEQAAQPIREMVRKLLPTLQTQLNNTATSTGRVFGALADAIGEIPVEHITTMFERMNSAIDILRGAMRPLVRAFTTLGLVGSKQFERLATWLVTLSEKFDAFIQKAAENGDLDRWIENAIEGMKNIGRSIDGAIGIFNALNTAAERAGFGGLKTFADSLQRAAAIMQTPAFQTTLTIYLDGARDLAIKLGNAIRDLGPAFESFAPTANIALNNIGDAVSRIIRYVGQIFTNPTFQEGVRLFTASLDTAIAKLEPAIKPFSDSLGTALGLLGKILEGVAQIAAAFVIELGPVLDSMAGKLGTLVKPLADSVTKIITDMKGPLETLDREIVGPLVAAFNEKILPALSGPGGFSEKFAEFVSKVVTDVSPAFKAIVDTILPELIRLAGNVLEPLGKLIGLLSPLFAETVERIGAGLKTMNDALSVLSGEVPIEAVIKWPTPEQIKAQDDEAKRIIAENMSGKGGTSSWGDIIADLFWGERPDVFWAKVYAKIGPSEEGAKKWDESVGMWLEGARSGIVDIFEGADKPDGVDTAVNNFLKTAIVTPFEDGIKNIQEGRFGSSEEGAAKWNEYISRPIQQITDALNSTADEGGLNDTVNTWLKDHIGDPFNTAMDNFGKAIPESFKSDVEEWGLGPAIVNWFHNDIAPEIGKGFTEGWKNIAEGRWGTSPEGAEKWEGFWAGWNGFWGDTGNLADEIDKNVNKWWDDNVSQPVQKAIDNAWKSISEWWTSGGGEGGGRGDNNGQQAWQDFWNGFGSMISDANSNIEDFNATVNDWLDKNVWEPIGKWFEELDWEQIAEDLWSGFIEAMTGKDVDTWEKIKSGFTGWVEDMKAFFGIASPSTLMAGFAGDIVTGFLNGFGDFATRVGEKWEEIKTTVGTKFEELKAGLAEKWEGFKTGWNDFWGGVGTTLGEKWEEFKTTAGEKWEGLRSGLAEKWEGFKTGWSEFWGGVGTTLGEKWEGFKTTASTKFEELKSGIETVGGHVKTGWDGFWGGVGTTLSEKWEEFKKTTSDKSGEIQKNVGTFGEDVKRNWGGFWGDVGKTLSDKWGEFTGTTEKKSGEISGDVNQMAGTVKGDWQGMLSQMGAQVTASFQNFVNTVSGKIGEIVSWVAGIPGRIMGALGHLGNLLWSAGSAIMGSFLQGLQSQWGGITSFVGSIADWIARNKGPLEYDRKLLEPAGEAIMLGLQRGLESRMDPLLNTLQAITDAMNDSVTADLSKSKMYVTGKDAAQGLADGLKANRSAVHTAIGSLGAFTVPDSSITIGAASGGLSVDQQMIPGKQLTIAEGAIQITTPTKDPEQVAAKVLDGFSHYSSF